MSASCCVSVEFKTLDYRAASGKDALLSELPKTFNVHIEPGGHDLRVARNENVLGVALAAGIQLPHSCRGGRCASCKSKLHAGSIEYPDGTPPGITPAEIAKGEVLLCQAQPRSDLSIEVRRVPVRSSNAAMCELVSLEALPLGALRARLRYVEGTLDTRPGQFVDVRNHAGDSERLAVIGVSAGEIDVEALDDGGALREWLSAHAAAGARLRVAGPFDRPR